MRSRLCNACKVWSPVSDWGFGCPQCGHDNGSRVSDAGYVIDDLPGYQSTVNGIWVEGRRQRREDLKRTRSRPWEGLEQERKESERQKQYHEKKLEHSLTKAASEAYYQLPPSKRAILRGN